MYTRLYQQCYPSRMSNASNTKFLMPTAPVYYSGIGEEVAENIIYDDSGLPRPFDRPEQLKWFQPKLDPASFRFVRGENLLPGEKELTKAQLNNGKDIIENYPPRCKFCTRGSDEIPGVSWVGRNEKIIENEIHKNPHVCNYPNRQHHQKSIERYENLEQELPTSLWGPSMWESIHSCCFWISRKSNS